MNTGYAMINGFAGSIIMGTDDILRMYKTMSAAKIIAVHKAAIKQENLSMITDSPAEFIYRVRAKY